MSRFIPISKAAKIAGLSTHDFQTLLQNHDLAPVRGMIHLDDLIELCPQVDAQETDMIEWVEHIKVHIKEHPEHKQLESLTREQLIEELHIANKKMTFYQHRLSALEGIMRDTCEALKLVKQHSSEPNRVQSLIAWLNNKLHQS